MSTSDETTQEHHCPSCGSPFGANARFCRGCGAARPGTPAGVTSHVEVPTAAHSPAQPQEDALTSLNGGLGARPEQAQPAAAYDAASPLVAHPTAPPGSPNLPQGGVFPAVPPGNQPPPPAGHPAAPAPGYRPPSQADYHATAPGYPQPPQTSYPATPSAYQALPPGYPGYVGQPPGYQPPPPAGYPTPATGYPVQQAQAPLPQPPEKKRPTPSRWLIGGIVAAVMAIVGIGLAIVLTAGGSSTQTRLLAAPVVTGAAPAASTASSSSASAAPSTHKSQSKPSTPVATKPAPVIAPIPRASIASQIGQQQEVKNTIQREFSLITEHKFSAAYALLAPSLQTGESGWVNAHRGEGIYNVSVATSATINSPDSATASITKMRTLDGEGCKNWTGSWNLTKIDGQWRINEANINAAPC
jgi:hypothetical protein